MVAAPSYPSPCNSLSDDPSPSKVLTMASVISFAHTLSNFTNVRKSSITFLNNKMEIYSQMFYVMAGDFISENGEKFSLLDLSDYTGTNYIIINDNDCVIWGKICCILCPWLVGIQHTIFLSKSPQKSTRILLGINTFFVTPKCQTLLCQEQNSSHNLVKDVLIFSHSKLQGAVYHHINSGGGIFNARFQYFS